VRQNRDGLLPEDEYETATTYELDDFAVVQPTTGKADKQAQANEAKHARRRQKREVKKRWLEERDEMKFSHSIQFNAVPDWTSHYLAYSTLKKL
jgi:hypothetical protein